MQDYISEKKVRSTMSKTFEHDGCVGCKYEKESESSDYCKGCKQNAVDKYVRMTHFDKLKI